jgi:hypothetical protein
LTDRGADLLRGCAQGLSHVRYKLFHLFFAISLYHQVGDKRVRISLVTKGRVTDQFFIPDFHCDLNENFPNTPCCHFLMLLHDIFRTGRWRIHRCVNHYPLCLPPEVAIISLNHLAFSTSLPGCLVRHKLCGHPENKEEESRHATAFPVFNGRS